MFWLRFLVDSNPKEMVQIKKHTMKSKVSKYCHLLYFYFIYFLQRIIFVLSVETKIIPDIFLLRESACCPTE